MVLSHRRSTALWVLALGLLATGCIRRPPPVKLAEATGVAVAYVADPESGGGVYDVPFALKEQIAQALGARNLTVEEVPFARMEEPFSRVRASARRFQLLEEGSKAPLLLLVEAKAGFFSLIGGRYRWVVQAKLTAHARGDEAQPTTRAFETPVVLVFDHQREADALAEAAPRIAEQAGFLFDDLLATPSGPPAAAAKDGTGAIYFVMVDRFANGDPSNDGEVDPGDPSAFHGGDLQGVLDKLDFLKAQGVETVWLSPVFKMRTEKFFGYGAFHGYWVEDLRAVEPRFGDLALLRKLSDALHQRGMKLVLDMVLNHVGPETSLVKAKPGWFHHNGPIEDWDDPVELVTRDVHGLPDLAQEKEEVYRYLLESSLFWIDEVRPDGFRLDAVKHMPWSFWARYTKDVRAHAGEDFLLLGEVLDGDPRVLSRAMRDGGFDALFDFPLHFAVNDVFCRGKPVAKLGAALSADRLYEDPSRLVTLVDNHDLPRLASTCEGDRRGMEQALLFTLTARGTPSLTWGTEAALEGEKEPDNRADMRFDRLPLRPFLTKVMAARAEHPSLREGAPLLLEVTASHLAYARVTPKEAAVILVNRSASPRTVELAGARIWSDPLSNEKAERPKAEAGEVRIWVAQGDFSEEHARAEAWVRGHAEPREVLLTVDGAPLVEGATLKVVGSAPELGGWDPSRAPAIPKGQRHLRLLMPPGTVSEYKLVLVGGDGAVQWEDRPNRILFVREGQGALALDARWERRDQAQAEAVK